MTFIEGNAFKYLSVKLPALGAFIMLVLIPALQVAVDYQIIPTQYHAFITGAVMMALSWFGRKIYQPSLHEKVDAPSTTPKDDIKQTTKTAVKDAVQDVAFRELNRQILKKAKRRK